jgi:hypothetical protein
MDKLNHKQVNMAERLICLINAGDSLFCVVQLSQGVKKLKFYERSLLF